jgi:hypothetical protein
MRLWLVKPELMCRYHLLGEHSESHMFLGAMDKNKVLLGFYDHGLFFGPRFLWYRHNELTPFMNHRTPMAMEDVLAASVDREWMRGRQHYPDVIPTEKQIKESRLTLLTRCKFCRRRHLDAKRASNLAATRYTVDTSDLLGAGSAADSQRIS